MDSFAKDRIIAGALRLAAARPWRSVTLSDIAAEAGVPLSELAQHFASKSDILTAFNRQVDDAVLRKAQTRPADLAERDQLFEVVMQRLDALTPHKAALASILAQPSADPGLLRSLLGSQRWMLQAAGIDTDGPRGAFRIAGLASVYAQVLRIWLEDDDPGLARTMAALDRRLRSGERTVSTIDQVCQAGERVMGMLRPGARRASNADGPSQTAG